MTISNSTTFDHDKWNHDFKIASEKKEGFRELRADIFKGTLSIVNFGSYSINQETIKINNGSIHTEFLQSPDILQPLDKTKTEFSVFEEDCLEVTESLLKSGFNPCVLTLVNSY